MSKVSLILLAALLIGYSQQESDCHWTDCKTHLGNLDGTDIVPDFMKFKCDEGWTTIVKYREGGESPYAAPYGEGCSSWINILKAFDHKFLCCKNNVVHGDVAKECESQTYHYRDNKDCKAGQVRVAKDDKYFFCCNKGFLTASAH